MGGQHPGERVNVAGVDLGENLLPMLAEESHKIAELEEDVLLENLDVCLGLPEGIKPLPTEGVANLSWVNQPVKWVEMSGGR